MNRIKNFLLPLIIALGIIVRGFYIAYTPSNVRQHDALSIYNSGHLGYIYTLFNDKRLPDSNDYQFYHPPLFHITGAIWLKAENMLGMDIDSAVEGLQVLTLIYSVLILFVIYKILKKVKLKEWLKVIIMMVMTFHPTFIILSGSINNDILMILLMFVIILYLLKWNEETTIKNTILLAIFTGLCVMTKLSRSYNGGSYISGICYEDNRIF